MLSSPFMWAENKKEKTETGTKTKRDFVELLSGMKKIRDLINIRTTCHLQHTLAINNNFLYYFYIIITFMES